MLPYFLANYLSGEASTRQSFAISLIALGLWGSLGIILSNIISTILSISGLVLAINLYVFGWGAMAIYGASIISHSIRLSYKSAVVKFGLRFLNFIILFIGIVLMIFVSSGELSWMIYLYNGIHR